MTSRAPFSSMSVDWPTPEGVYKRLDSEFHFNFDPCPLGSEIDGTSLLFCPWQGKRVFCNPPYGRGIYSFLRRWHQPDCAVYLLPARVDTKWFHTICLPHARDIRFIEGRLRFGDGEGSAPFPSMVVVFGE